LIKRKPLISLIGGMKESHSTKIKVPGVKSDVFKAILQFIYCDEVELDEELALELILVADEYLMKDLTRSCGKYLSGQLRKANVVDTLIIAERHEMDELKNACFAWIIEHIHNIHIDNEDLMELPVPLFKELINFKHSVPKEHTLYCPSKTNFIFMRFVLI